MENLKSVGVESTSHHDQIDRDPLIDEVFADWSRASARLDPAILQGGQALVPPYIIDRFCHGTPTRNLIASVEGVSWYDNLNPTEAPQVQNLGMLRPGDTVFDCGANQGVNTLVYSDVVGPEGRVYSFDPFPLNGELIRLNAKLNRRVNIEVVPFGLSNAESEFSVSVGEQCIKTANQAATDMWTIKLRTLDTFAHLRPSYIKIDIEGAEVDALEGAGELLSQGPCLYIEIHPMFLPRFGRTAMDLFKYLDSDKFIFFVNYPGYPANHPYEMEFELVEPSALFVKPRSRPVSRRFYPLYSS